MKHLLAGAALLGTTLGAQAADIAVKAPYHKAPVAAIYDWTGFYVGVNAGIGVGRDRTTHNIPGAFADTFYLQPQGGFGGAQIGYNWQTPSVLGPLVLGVEADIQGGDLRDNYPALFGFSANSYNQKIDWFATARGRIGIATGPVLSYFTAGYAYGDVKTNGQKSRRAAARHSRSRPAPARAAGPTAAASKRRSVPAGPARSNTSTSISAASPLPSRSGPRPSIRRSARTSTASA